VTYDGATTSPSYVVSDPLGSTAVTLNTAGTVTDRFFYQPFGSASTPMERPSPACWDR